MTRTDHYIDSGSVFKVRAFETAWTAWQRLGPRGDYFPEDDFRNRKSSLSVDSTSVLSSPMTLL